MHNPLLAERYQVVKNLGRGPMSAVMLVLDIQTQEQVVLKVMTTITEDDRRNRKAYERFVREIQIAGSLQHSGILPIIDYGEMLYQNRMLPFLVLPYIRQGSLAEFLKERPSWELWSFPQIADAITQAAESLYYLHTRRPQIVHQDVKPGNFLVKVEQRPDRIATLYLCDFGISRWRRSDAALASEVLGTFAYMAPEQIKRNVDAASDQYALALMATYLLTGKLAIQAETNEGYIEAHLHEPPFPPSILNPDRISSVEVDRVLLRALEKRPSRRYSTIVDFAAALRRALDHFARQNTHPDTTLRDPHTRTTVPVADHPSLPPFPVPQNFPINLDPISTGGILDEPLPAKPPKNNSAVIVNDIAPVALPARELARFDLPARPKQLAWSPDGQSLACLLYGPAHLLIHLDGAFQEVRLNTTSQATALCWSPDSRVLAILLQRELYFWDVAAQRELPLHLRFTGRSIENIDWSADGRLALWVEHQILIYMLSSHALVQQNAQVAHTIPTNGMRGGGTGVLRWSPDNSLLAAGASSGEVLCWSATRYAPTWHVQSADQKKVNSLIWSPDSSSLFVAFRDNRVVGWQQASRQPILLWEKLTSMPRLLTISARDHLVIASSEKRLLLGFPDEPAPSSFLAGQLLAAWSPISPQLATLNEHRETSLLLWHE